MDGGAFEPESAATGASHQEYTARPGYRTASQHPTLGQGNGPSSVCAPYGDDGAGCDGHDGRDAIYHRRLWNGCVLGLQAAEGIGNSYGARRSAQGSVTGGARARIQIACFWLGRRIASRNSSQPGAGFHRVSGNSPRSAGIGRSCSSYVAARAAGYVDSGAARAVDRSYDTAARGVSYRGAGPNRFFDSQEERCASSPTFSVRIP